VTRRGGAPVPEFILTAKAITVCRTGRALRRFIALVDNKIKRESLRSGQGAGIRWRRFMGRLRLYLFLLACFRQRAQHRVSLRHSGPALSPESAAPQEPGNIQRYTLFVGPKELTLKSLGKDWNVPSISAISASFQFRFSTSAFFNGFTGSYGIDIILLTVVIKLLMAPLTHKSFVSMKQMQKLQPQMERLKKIQRRQRKLNKEVMELYRRNGVNPLGGCLPMVLNSGFHRSLQRFEYAD
jgi:hypothetical protein